MSTSTDDAVVLDTDALPEDVASAGQDATADGRKARRRPRLRVPHPTGRARRNVVVALTAAAVVLACAVGYLGWGALQTRATESARTDAVAAAADSLPKLLTYDPASIDKVPGLIDELTIGQFHDVFRQTFQQVIGPNAKDQQASSSATVAASSWIQSSSDQVTVLLLLDQHTKSTKLVGERIDTVQARVTMQKIDGRWLVSGLDQV